MEAELSNPYILIFEKKISFLNSQTILPFLEASNQSEDHC